MTRSGASSQPVSGGGSFHAMWRELLPVGRHPDSRGYRRFAWTGADADCRAWFKEQAEAPYRNTAVP